MRRRLCHATITTPFRRPSRWLFDAPDDRVSDRLEDVIVEDFAVVDVVVADDVADDRPECADEVAVLPGAERCFSPTPSMSPTRLATSIHPIPNGTPSRHSSGETDASGSNIVAHSRRHSGASMPSMT
jgi:hypothetical protein